MIWPMKIEQIDVVDPQALQRLVHGLLDILGRAVDRNLGLHDEPTLGREEDLVSFPRAFEPTARSVYTSASMDDRNGDVPLS